MIGWVLSAGARIVICPVDRLKKDRSEVAGGAGQPLDEDRLDMLRRHRTLTAQDRFALLDRLCRDMTRIASSARRVR